MTSVSSRSVAAPTRWKDTAALARRWLAVWLVSRAVVTAIVIVTALLLGVDKVDRRHDLGHWLLYRFAHFDSHLYGAIAARGYAAKGKASYYNAFFPGLPGVLRAWQDVAGSDGRWGGLLAVLVAGAALAVVLGLLATDITGRPAAGMWAVVALSVTPLTVFFSVVYTEAIFMAASVAAWYAARQGRWALAGTLALITCTFRLNGLFLVAALAVMFALERHQRPQHVKPRHILWLALGPAFVLSWAAWLHRLTGDWNSWGAAQQAGWGRHLAWPWVGIGACESYLVDATSWQLAAPRVMELAALLIPVAAIAYFVRQSDWPVVTLIGLNGFTLLFSSLTDSGPRYVLVWFPLYVTAASWLSRTRPSVAWAIVAAAGSLAVLVSIYWGAQWWVA